jgi:hypothetical protein
MNTKIYSSELEFWLIDGMGEYVYFCQFLINGNIFQFKEGRRKTFLPVQW